MAIMSTYHCSLLGGAFTNNFCVSPKTVDSNHVGPNVVEVLATTGILTMVVSTAVLS